MRKFEPLNILIGVSLTLFTVTALAGPIYIISTDTGMVPTVDPTSKALRTITTLSAPLAWDDPVGDPWASLISDSNLLAATRGYFSVKAYPFTLSTTNLTITTTDTITTMTGTYSYSSRTTTANGFSAPPGWKMALTSFCVSTRQAGATAPQGIQARLRVSRESLPTTSSAVVAVVGAGTEVGASGVGVVNATLNNDIQSCVSFSLGSQEESMGSDSSIILVNQYYVGVSRLGTATAGNDIYVSGYIYR